MDLALLEELQRAKAEKRQVVLATNLTNGHSKLMYPFEIKEENNIINAARSALQMDRPQEVETDEGPVFLNIFNPPLRLFVVGAVHIAQKLVPMAAAAGYDVTVIDPRRSFASDLRFPDVALDTRWPDEALSDLAPDRRSALVTLTHDAKLDDPALQAALRTDMFYIGALGSTRTRAKREDRLTEAGFSKTDMDRIHGPVGLDIGARNPAEIAISIMAELTLILRKGARHDL
ncbi:XdhC family protein [Sneathiella chinensis]|uniref:XdhC Rossmann domain-containing protein n=1 Tax=Sneathiella chinensis TaxID=349750 RepID=A0ABQ5U4I7_9PROT|nr:XdhC family protein [Sneathiella chinensis]GLQ07082.1 hypothetical protein GCM10007924_23030 [Sneathiella chinensis]